MIDYHFFLHGPPPLNAMYGYYDYSLVLLSYIVAVFASYVALDLVGRLRLEPDRKIKYCWLAGGAFVMGAGIWTMHFIGMLAYILPMPVFYDSLWTGISFVTPIFGCAAAFFVLRGVSNSILTLTVAGIIMGLSIVAMHYIGMEAMESPNSLLILYLPGIFIISTAIAIIASEAAIWFALKSNQGPSHQQLQFKILSALVMGVAVCGMHYTGMAAAVFIPRAQMIATISNAIPVSALALYITVVIVIIFFVALIISTQRQLVLGNLQRQSELEKLRKSEISNETLENHAHKRTIELKEKNIELSAAIKKMKAAQNKLVHSEKMATIGQLAAGVAHEVNNPLAYVTSNIGLLGKHCEAIKRSFDLSANLANKIRSGQLDDIRKTADEIIRLNDENQIGHIIQELKDMIDESNAGLLKIKNIVVNLAQFASDNHEFKELIDINGCIESAIEIVWSQLKYKAEVQKNLSNLPKIVGSFKQLEIVIINLLLNAIQSIHTKGDITISTEIIDDYIVIKISDNGCGIDPNNISKIFTPFFTTRPIGEGRGLGLSTSYGIIQNHGGTITVESQIDKGSTFTIKLPVENKQ